MSFCTQAAKRAYKTYSAPGLDTDPTPDPEGADEAIRPHLQRATSMGHIVDYGIYYDANGNRRHGFYTRPRDSRDLHIKKLMK